MSDQCKEVGEQPVSFLLISSLTAMFSGPLSWPLSFLKARVGVRFRPTFLVVFLKILFAS